MALLRLPVVRFCQGHAPTLSSDCAFAADSCAPQRSDNCCCVVRNTSRRTISTISALSPVQKTFFLCLSLGASCSSKRDRLWQQHRPIVAGRWRMMAIETKLREQEGQTAHDVCRSRRRPSIKVIGTRIVCELIHPRSAATFRGTDPVSSFKGRRITSTRSMRDGSGLTAEDDFLQESNSSLEDFLDVEWKDGDLDEIFEKFGETLYVDPRMAELAKVEEDDTEAEKFALAMASAAYDTKAADIRVLYVKPLVQWTRYFVVVSAFSRPQIDAILKKVRDIALTTFNRTPYGGDGERPNNWTVVDFEDVIVHIFLPRDREFYNLEGYYLKAQEVKLPFVSPTIE